MNANKFKRWINNFLIIVISCFFHLNDELIFQMLYIHELIIILLVVASFNSIGLFLERRRLVQEGEIIKIKSQYDALGRIFIFGFLTLFILFIINQISLELSGKEMLWYFALLIVGIILGFTIQTSTFFEPINEHTVGIKHKDFFIDTLDRKIEFSKYRIVILNKEGKSKSLREIILDKKEALKLKNWILGKIKNSEMDFYWKAKEIVKPL